MIFGCFHKENLTLVNPKALDVNDEAFFLATHTPVPLVQQDRKLADQGQFTETQFLSQFTDVQKRYAFALVRGTVGVGKSHLIRWTYIKLKQLMESGQFPRTRLHLIERSGTNLRDIIRRIIGDLGGEILEDTRRRLAEGEQKLSRTGLNNSLLDNLAIQVDPESLEHPENILSTESGEKREALEYCLECLPVLFRDDVFRRSFIRSGNIVDELVELTIGQAQERKVRDRERRFSPDDFLLQDAEIDSAGVRARDFARDLERDSLLRETASKYVNSRLPAAVRSLINLGKANFTEVFREVRRELHQQGEQLILLIEDIAAFEFVDHQLLEALIEEPGSDLCPLRSAVGVTDGFLEKIDATHLGRTTLRLRLSVPDNDIDSYVHEFTANYLRALRTPLSTIEQWARDGADGRPPGPEPDETTERHAIFDEISGTSLFPFNKRALSSIRSEKYKTGAPFNARSFLDEVICDTLENFAADFDQSRFPSKRFRERYGRFQTPPGRMADLRTKFGSHHEQVAVIEEIWGADVSSQILVEFGVPLDKTVAATTVKKSDPPQVPEEKPQKPAATKPKPTLDRPPFNAKTQDALQGLTEWFHGGAITQDALQAIREILSKTALSAVDWDRHFIKRSDWSSHFKPPAFNLVDQKVKPTTGQWSIEIPRHIHYIDVTFALQGLLLYEHYGNWNFEYDGQNAAFLVRHVVPFVEWLASQLIDKIYDQTSFEKEELLQNGLFLLYTASRLQGRAGENALLPEVVNDLFDTSYKWDESIISANGSSWRELYKAFGRWHKILCGLMIVRLNCAKSSGPSTVLDAGYLLPLLSKLKRSKAIPPVPDKLYKDWDCCRKLSDVCNQHISNATEQALEVHRQWQSKLNDQLGDTKRDDLTSVAIQCIEHASEAAVLRAKFSGRNISGEDLKKACKNVERSTLDKDRLESQRIVERSEKDGANLDSLLPRLAGFDWSSAESTQDLIQLLESFIQETSRVVEATPEIDPDLQSDAELLQSQIKLLEGLYARFEELSS